MASGFHEVQFPLRLALATSGGPVRRTEIVQLSNGSEARNARWRDARRSYDAGSGLRSLADLYDLVAFFEARFGQLNGFRFRDPVDNRSGRPGEPITPVDQAIGIGNGEERTFQLVKIYADAGGSSLRTITKPVAGSVTVALGGVIRPTDAFDVDVTTGQVTFDAAPGPGAVVSAGFEFDVPVRFDIDRIEINLTAFRAGQIPSIPLLEIKP
jgi:uncharacterized protein (TIGR02217 family)